MKNSNINSYTAHMCMLVEDQINYHYYRKNCYIVMVIQN